MASSEKSKGTDASFGDVFDVRRVRQLVELMKENELTELNIQQGDLRIQLQRAASQPLFASSGVAPLAVPQPVPAISASAQGIPGPAPSTAEVQDDLSIKVIKSPMVGTYYAAPDPNSQPFVKIGDTVDPDKTVCLIEAMKVFNEIQAEVAGRIVAVLKKPGDAVEFGAPLFKVDTRG